MKKIIVVEDAYDELQRACDAVGEKDMMALPCRTDQEALDAISRYSDVVGILTDLHFPFREGRNPEGACGLHVVLKALEKGLPVAICSNIDHHFANWATDLVRAIEQATGKKVAGFVQDSKDWERAVSLLLTEKGGNE